MSLYRILRGNVKTGDGWKQPGEDIELSAEAAGLLNKNGRKTVEPTSVAVAREKAAVDAKAAVEKAEKAVAHEKAAVVTTAKGGGK